MVVVFIEYGQSTFLKVFSWGSSKSVDSKDFGVDHRMVGFGVLVLENMNNRGSKTNSYM